MIDPLFSSGGTEDAALDPSKSRRKNISRKEWKAKMENKFKRFLSLLLAFTMVLSYVPVQSFADGRQASDAANVWVCSGRISILWRIRSTSSAM